MWKAFASQKNTEKVKNICKLQIDKTNKQSGLLTLACASFAVNVTSEWFDEHARVTDADYDALKKGESFQFIESAFDFWRRQLAHIVEMLQIGQHTP